MAVSSSKAKEIMKHGEVHGKALTKRQMRFFGARASGLRQTFKRAVHERDALK